MQSGLLRLRQRPRREPRAGGYSAPLASRPDNVPFPMTTIRPQPPSPADFTGRSEGSGWGMLPVGFLLAFAAVAGTLRLRAYDTFWHLAAGRWILEHRAVPRL